MTNDLSATEIFTATFQEFAPYPDVVIAIVSLMRRHIMNTGQLLVTEGEINDRLFFIAKGVVRGFYYTDTDTDTSVTSWFECKGGYVAIPHCYFFAEPSRESVEVLVGGLAFSIGRRELQCIKEVYPAINAIADAITARYVTQREHQIRALRMTSAQQRVEYFRTTYPDTYKQVPLKHVASFLGITPQTLSKIRSKK